MLVTDRAMPTLKRWPCSVCISHVFDPALHLRASRSDDRDPFALSEPFDRLEQRIVEGWTAAIGPCAVVQDFGDRTECAQRLIGDGRTHLLVLGRVAARLDDHGRTVGATEMP